MLSTSPRSLLILNTGGLDLSTFAWDHQVYRSIFISAVAILIYDHFLTLESEVKWVWLPRHRPATYWFFLVRYMAIVATATYATFYFGDFLPEVCLLFLVVDGIFISPQTFQVTLGLRVFAMYGSDLRVLALMTVPGTATVALIIWTIIGLNSPGPVMLTAPGFIGCHTVAQKSRLCLLNPINDAHLLVGLASAWFGKLVCDFFVLVLTLRRAYVNRDVAEMMSVSLTTVMARDGRLFNTTIIVLVNLANVLMIYVRKTALLSFYTWLTLYSLVILSTSLLCRLMLNLHEAAHIEGASQIRENNDSTQLESLHFVQHGRPQIRTLDRDDESV
ncbi:hypothetical protein C8J57DRAFT_1306629 [Mycena rebaudengoi]|nr:hypothetical protein C8J57DRAFT_1306629 [Mycena rebaudengoi]